MNTQRTKDQEDEITKKALETMELDLIEKMALAGL